jgi:transposase
MSHAGPTNSPTDLTDEQWQILRPLLPPPSRRGAPQTVCRRAVVNAILYVLRSGCAWRLLPHEFPHWKALPGKLPQSVVIDFKVIYGTWVEGAIPASTPACSRSAGCL